MGLFDWWKPKAKTVYLPRDIHIDDYEYEVDLVHAIKNGEKKPNCKGEGLNVRVRIKVLHDGQQVRVFNKDIKIDTDIIE